MMTELVNSVGLVPRKFSWIENDSVSLNSIGPYFFRDSKFVPSSWLFIQAPMTFGLRHREDYVITHMGCRGLVGNLGWTPIFPSRYTCQATNSSFAWIGSAFPASLAARSTEFTRLFDEDHSSKAPHPMRGTRIVFIARPLGSRLSGTFTLPGTVRSYHILSRAKNIRLRRPGFFTPGSCNFWLRCR